MGLPSAGECIAGEWIGGAVSGRGAPLPLRPDLVRAHARTWDALATPGTFWSGAERVAIAAETRRARGCRLCAERKAALSPAVVAGAHDHDGTLPEPAVEAIHRIVTDPARLSRGWLDGLRTQGLDDARYVELLGVAARTVAVDAFARGVGAAPPPLPAPIPGAPSGLRASDARPGEAWVPMRSLREPNVARALSLVPAEVDAVRGLLAAHYVPFERVPDLAFDPGRALSRAQMELVAARVSARNECFY
jgi:hypothetical protein